MLKHTKKPDCCCARCLLLDAGGVKARSKKFADTRTSKYVPVATGWPGKEQVWISEPIAPPVSELPFNTSAQLPPSTAQAQLEKKLKNRARSKFITNTIAVPLASICSPLENSYKTTLRCSGHLTETEGKLSGLYCGQRWCVVCSRIRTARMVAGYLPQLEEMPDKWFLTLTRKNVPAELLPATITDMLRTATLINRNLKEKAKLKYSSLRKLECTYNAKDREYHPHFHFIFDSEVAALAYLAQWKSRHAAGIVDDKGQDLKKADNQAVKELFKYFTKIATSKKYNKQTGKIEDYAIHIGAMDIMFQAMRGKRVFQPCGMVKAVSEEIEPEFALPTERDLTACYSWMGTDWIDRTTGNVLCGYEPSSTVKEIASHIVMPKRRTMDVVDYETGEVVTRDVERHAELPIAPPDAPTMHEYGPMLPRSYRAPVYCSKSRVGAASRRWIARPAVFIQSEITAFSLPSRKCKHSTQLLPVPFKSSRDVPRPRRARSGGASAKCSS